MSNISLQDPRTFKMSAFALSLLTMDARIKAYSIFGDIIINHGYLPRKKDILISVMLPTAEHDIAHMVEMRDSKRWVLPDWGMPLASNNNDLTQMSKDGFFVAFAREIRVRAIQLCMCPHEMGKLHSTMFNILNNDVWKFAVKSMLPHKRFQSMKDVTLWMEYLRDKTYHAWSVDRIRYEWLIRLEYIQHWMES